MHEEQNWEINEAGNVEDHICSMCGINLADCKNWGPICKKTRRRVCDVCCFNCEHHRRWSGLWECTFRTPEERREAAIKRNRERFEEENRKVSQAYWERKREEARLRAIKAARARARKK